MYSPIDKAGGLTFAFGYPYQRMAYALALTLRRCGLPLTVVISEQDFKDGRVYPGLENEANLIVLPGRYSRFEYEGHAYDLSPYETTIKFDADMIIPSESYVTSYLELINMLGIVSGMACDLSGNYSTSSVYRKIETRLDLPIVYSAAFGFAKGDLAHRFFERVKFLFKSWYALKVFSADLPPTTDSIYSIAWKAVMKGVPHEGLPFLHMKAGIAGSNIPQKWGNKIPYSLDDVGRLRVNSHQIRVPFHYYDKDFLSDALLEKIEGKAVTL